MRSDLTPDEVDAVMANIHPSARRWCSIGCGPRPGDDVELLKTLGCACSGCLYGALSWDEFEAWEKREAQRESTRYIEYLEAPIPMNLEDRLASYKASKRNRTLGLDPYTGKQNG